VLNNYSRVLEDDFRGLQEQPIDRKEKTIVLCCALARAPQLRNYFFNRFSLCFLLFSSLSLLVIGFFLLLPMLNAITTLK
jgi:hypothetical protein